VTNRFVAPLGDCTVDVRVPQLDTSRRVLHVAIIGRERIQGDPNELHISFTTMHPQAYTDSIVRSNLHLCGYVTDQNDRRAVLHVGVKYAD
jgi:hypothetical protein